MKKLSIFVCFLTVFAAFACSDGVKDTGTSTRPPGSEEENTEETEGTEGTEGQDTSDGVQIGKTLPDWSEGYLDLHVINSADGECNFFILPDGTTLLIDAGEEYDSSNSFVARKPNSNVRPYMVYATYIKHFLPNGRKSIDYCAPSHFHIDHIGDTYSSTSTAAGGYALSGITALYDEVPYDRLIDPGYPSYNDDTTIPDFDGRMITQNGDYQKFVSYNESTNGMKCERFQVGVDTQFVLVNNPSSYPTFSIFNICCNANCYYSGTIEDLYTKNPTTDYSGNPASAGIHIKYGNFDLFTCGDLTEGPQNRMAYYYRDYAKGQVDVFKANHHLKNGSWGSQMRSQEFSPRVVVASTFHNSTTAPYPTILEGIFSDWDGVVKDWTKDVFCTNVSDVALAADPIYSQITDYNGHIVVRVDPSGDFYYVYMLYDTDYDYRVKSIYGPYDCK